MAWGIKAPWKAQQEAVETSPGVDEISSSSDHGSTTVDPGEKQRDIAVETDELDRFEKSHQFDQNIPKEKLDEMRDALRTGDVEIIQEDVDLIESSPYEEVRAAVRETDGGEVSHFCR